MITLDTPKPAPLPSIDDILSMVDDMHLYISPDPAAYRGGIDMRSMSRTAKIEIDGPTVIKSATALSTALKAHLRHQWIFPVAYIWGTELLYIKPLYQNSFLITYKVIRINTHERKYKNFGPIKGAIFTTVAATNPQYTITGNEYHHRDVRVDDKGAPYFYTLKNYHIRRPTEVAGIDCTIRFRSLKVNCDYSTTDVADYSQMLLRLTDGDQTTVIPGQELAALNLDVDLDFTKDHVLTAQDVSLLLSSFKATKDD